MGIKYVVTVFVSTLFWAGGPVGCSDNTENEGPAPAAMAEEAPVPPILPAPIPGPRHEANGISFADLAGARYEDEIAEGIAMSRGVYPDGVLFVVLSSPNVVPSDQALEIQLTNARLAAEARGRIVEDADAPGRPFVIGELEGRRIIYQTGDTLMHTEVFAFEANDRTVTVFIEVPDPPNHHRDVIDTLTSSLRVD